MSRLTMPPDELANMRVLTERFIAKVLADRNLREELRTHPDQVLQEFGFPPLVAIDLKREVMIDGQNLHATSGARCLFTCDDTCAFTCFITEPATSAR